MINYVIKITLGTEEVQAVICSRIENDFFNVFQLLSSKDSKFDSVLLSSSDDVSYPYLVCSSDGKLITPVYKLLKQFDFKVSDELAGNIVSKLSDKGLDLTVETLRMLEKCCSEFEQYINGKKVKIQVPSSRYDNFSRTKNLVKEINSSGEARTVYIEGENKTIFRKSVDDELFIRVPSYEDLYENLISLNPRQICEPYPSADFRTPSFRDFLEPYSLSVEEVIGNSENNNLDILPQETRYRNALIKLMEVGTIAQNPDVSLDDCKEQNIGSTLVLEYFKQLAMCAVAINWSHSGFMPKGYEDLDGSDDDDKETSSKDENSALGNVFWSAKGFESGHGKFSDNPDLINGSSFMSDLIDEMFQTDIYGIIDFIIRLFRFGKIKPSRVKINESEYVDLTKFIVHKTSGNYASIDFLTEEDGSNLFPLSSIRMTDMMTDKKYITSTNVKKSSIDMNIGLICERRFKGDSFIQKILISYLDLVKIYESNEPLCRIKGISFIDGKFSFSEETERILEDSSYSCKDLINLVKMKTDEFQFYCYNEFKDPFMEKTCWDRKISVIDIVDRFYGSKDLALISACDYSSIDELDDLCTKFQIPPRSIIEMNIASYVLPVFCEVSSLYEQGARSGDELTSAYVACLFNKVMISRGFTGKFGTEAVEKITSSVKKSSAFSEKNNNESDGRKKFLDNVIESSEGSLAFYSLSLNAEILSKVKGSMSSLVISDVDTATGNSVVGYIAVKEIEGKKIKIFIHPSDKPLQVVGSINILKTCPAIMGILAKSLEGSSPSNRFADTKSGIYYCSLGNVIYNYLATKELS